MKINCNEKGEIIMKTRKITVFAIASILGAIAASGIVDALIVSCDFVNYDYDKLRYEFKVGIKSESDPSGKITYFTAGSDHAVKCD